MAEPLVMLPASPKRLSVTDAPEPRTIDPLASRCITSTGALPDLVTRELMRPSMTSGVPAPDGVTTWMRAASTMFVPSDPAKLMLPSVSLAATAACVPMEAPLLRTKYRLACVLLADQQPARMDDGELPVPRVWSAGVKPLVPCLVPCAELPPRTRFPPLSILTRSL